MTARGTAEESVTNDLYGVVLGERTHDFSWAETPFGAPEFWPQSLRSAASICLNARFPIALYWGPQLALIYNDSWSPILGGKHPWAFARPGQEVWPEIWSEIGPLFEAVQQTGEGVWQQDRLLPMHRHGYTEECYFNFTLSPIRGEDGDVVGVFNAVIETTYRVIAERRAALLRDLSENTAGAKSAADVCTRAAALLERALADLPFCLFYLRDKTSTAFRYIARTGAALPAHLSPPVLDPGDDALPWRAAEALATARSISMSWNSERYGSAPESGVWSEAVQGMMTLPIAGQHNSEPRGLLIVGTSPRLALDEPYTTFVERVAQQITTAIDNAEAYEAERHRAEALAAIDAAKTAFFSNVSHEFRTPLTLMLGPLEDVLTQRNLITPDDRERLELVHRNALRLLRLVNTLLDFSRIEAGRLEASFAPTQLEQVTADLASVFRSAIERAGMDLIVDCPPLSETIYIDRELWEKIVLNLLSNAFKFTFTGSITVALREGEGAVELIVSDTGTGIPASEIPHIFKRFHQVKHARGRSFEGSGIGLSLVQELVRLHGGSIAVSSVVDQGTRFTIRIPKGSAHLPAERVRAEAETQHSERLSRGFIEEAQRWIPTIETIAASTANTIEAHLPPLPGQSTDDTRPRILLADDNADMRAYLRQLLSTRYQVTEVADGAAALEMARSESFDLILTDVMMPRLDGFTLLATLRAEAATQTLPVIMLSARAGEEARIAGVQAGADDYLVKPFSANELLVRVQSTLTLAQLRREAALRLAALQQVTASFADTQSLAEVRRVTLQEVRRALGADGGGVRRVAGEYLLLDEIETSAQLTEEEIQRYATLPLQAHHPATDTVRSGEATFFDDEQSLARRYPDLAAMAARHNTQAIAHLPLRRGHEVFGVLSLHFSAPRRWDATERAFALAVADRAAMAYERARLFEAERRARARAERLQAVTVALSNTSSPAEVYHAVLNQSLITVSPEANALRAQSGTLYIRSGDSYVLSHSEHANTGLIQQYRSFRLDAPIPAAQSIREARPIWIRSRADFIQQYPHLAEQIERLQSEAAVSLPLIVEERCLGVLNFTFAQPLAFDSDDQNFLQALAAQAAQALERARLFTAIRSSEAQLAAFMEHSPGLLAMKDASGRYTVANQAFLATVRKDADEVIGKRDEEIFAPEMAEQFIAEDAQVRASGEALGFEQRFVRDSRSAIFFSQKFVLPGGGIGYIGTDISERKEIEAERERLYAQEQAARTVAEEASRLKDEFLATVSHELRTPLTAFLGYAQLLQMRQRDAAYIARTVEKMVRSAKAQAQLIEDILDISRIVSGKTRIDFELVDLAKVVRTALDTVRSAVDAKAITIALNLGPTPVLVVGDSNRLQQVVWNLLANAAKFTPSGGSISIRLERAGPQQQLTISDTGQGIPAAFLPYVFDRFRQADSTTQRTHGGLGLGLAIVRHLVELHGGSVQVASAGEGRGATFTVLLPAADERGGAERRLPAADDRDEGCPPELNGLRVLLVDDHDDLLDLLEDILVPCGVQVRRCTEARAALALLRTWQPNVLVSDIAMPGEDGYWLIQQVRALPQEQGGTIPALALTAYVRIEDRLRVLASGFEQYIPKPVEPSELRAVIAQLVRGEQRYRSAEG
jgi:signal transduction histidine kinase/DNA-binding response OmpR family regulator